MVADSIQIILLFGLIGLVTNFIAWKKGYYRLTPFETPPIAFKHVVSVFCIYLGAVLIVAPYLTQMLLKFSARQPPSFGMVVALQFIIILAMALGLIIYCQTKGKEMFLRSKILGLESFHMFLPFQLWLLLGSFLISSSISFLVLKITNKWLSDILKTLSSHLRN